MSTPWRVTGLALLGALVLTAIVLVVQVRRAVAREYLPGDPGYAVDTVVEPGAGAGEGVRPLELVMLGDSTVAGVGSSTLAESLPVLTAQRVADLLDRPVHVVSYGESGARTNNVREVQVPKVLDQGVDVVAIVAGANDVTHATPFWQMQERTGAMLAAAREQASAPVVLGGIPQFRTVPALDQPLRSIIGAYASPLRNAQRAAAESRDGVTFVDIAALASPRFVGLPESMSADGFHPSPLGYGFWADALAPAIAEAANAAAQS